MSVGRGRTFVASLTVVAALAVTLAAQTPPAQTPTFRTGTEAVALDFLAIDAQGRPIADLKPAELKLTVDGKPRTIDSLKFIELAPGVPAAEKSALPLAKAVPAPFGSNLVRETGRTILVLVHHTSIASGEERLALDSTAKMLNDLTPRDRVGVITFPQGEVVSDLTTNHERTRTALAGVTGRKTRGLTGFPPGADPDRYVLRDLAAIINGFGKIEGPKTVILITQSMPAFSAYGNESSADDFVDLTKAASQVSAHFFVIQPHTFGAMGTDNRFPTDPFGAGTSGGALRSGSGVEDVTGAVGGELFSLSGTADSAMARITRVSSAYYLLGFSTTNAEHNGKGHKIGLSTTRAGVTVLARPTFVIPKNEPASKAKKPVTPQALLADAATHADLALRGVAYPFRESASTDIKLLVAFEPVTPGTTIASAAFALVDPKGKIAATWAADAADLALRPIVSAMHVKAGTYRVRIAARDAADRVGAVDYEFTAGLTKVGTIETGALMTGVMRDTTFEPRFTFGTETEAVAYTELYGADAAGATVRFEIAVTADGPALEVVQGELTPTLDNDRVIVTGRLPLITLPRGDVVVRAVVTSGTATAPIVRTLRKR